MQLATFLHSGVIIMLILRGNRSVSFLLFVVLLAGVLLLPNVSRLTGAPTAPPTTRPASERLKALQVERHKLLQQLGEAARTRFERGVSSVEELTRVEIALKQSELDLCETAAERLRVLEHMVESVRQQEKMCNARWRAGRLSESELVWAKTRTLEAEIELEQARLSAAPLESTVPAERSCPRVH